VHESEIPGVSDPWLVEQRWDLTYRHSADPVTSRFLQTLRDEGKLLGVRCPICRRVLAPPRAMCDRDYCATGEMVELGLQGMLELFTIMYLAVDGLPEPPYVLAYVRPEGASTAIPGVMHGVDLSSPAAALEQLQIGRGVEIQIAAQRRGRITDLSFALP
jgi:uncharacterized OB-fold protein